MTGAAPLVRLYLRLLSCPGLSRRVGALADTRLPGLLLRAVIAGYVRFYGVDLSESAAPLASFRTFNEFFTRRLRPGARPIDPAPGTVVAPCDATVYDIGPIPRDGRLEQVKGKTYSLEDLLADPEEAERFREGVQATLYLSPAAYHRVHWPVEGRVRGWRRTPGRLYPVNPLARRHVDRLFAVNERTAVTVESPDAGSVAVVLVGATNVGRITLAFDDAATNRERTTGGFTPARSIDGRRGDELGAFNLGSTVVLLVADDRLVPAGPAAGDTVKMGQALWRR